MVDSIGGFFFFTFSASVVVVCSTFLSKKLSLNLSGSAAMESSNTGCGWRRTATSSPLPAGKTQERAANAAPHGESDTYFTCNNLLTTPEKNCHTAEEVFHRRRAANVCLLCTQLGELNAAYLYPCALGRNDTSACCTISLFCWLFSRKLIDKEYTKQ